jgi:hypothetical protein
MIVSRRIHVTPSVVFRPSVVTESVADDALALPCMIILRVTFDWSHSSRNMTDQSAGT